MPADDPIAALAVGLNEDAKAARKRVKPKPAEPATVPEGAAKPEETLTDAVASLGASIDAQPGAGTDGYDLTEGAHSLAMDRMEAMATDAILSDKALVYDVRDFLLDQIKSRPKPWSGTSNGEQRDVAAACEHAGRELVRKIVEAIAARGAQDPVRVLLTKVTIGDDIVIAGKVKTTEESEENRAVDVLHKARGKHVLLTVASVGDFEGEAREADTIPDQTGLDFEAGNDDDLNPPD